jgi:co-chaperonin GroES (HSP10)
MRALGTKVVVVKHLEPKEEKSKGGIILKKLGEDKSPRRGSVISVGSDVKNLVASEDILYPRFAGVPFKDEDGIDYIVLEFVEVLVVL